MLANNAAWQGFTEGKGLKIRFWYIRQDNVRLCMEPEAGVKRGVAE